MVSNKVGAVLVGAGALGLLYLGSQGSAEGEQQFFGGSGGGFFSGSDEGNFTTDPDQPASNPYADLINAFLGPAQTDSTSSSDPNADASSFASGSSKKSVKAVSGSTIFLNEDGSIAGSYDPNRMASFNAEGTQKNLMADLFSTPSSQQFQGPVRPSDNEALFRLTGVSNGSSKKSSNSSSGALNYTPANGGAPSSPSTGGSSSSSSKKSLKTDSLSGSDKGKGSYTVTKSDGSKVKRFFQ